MFRVSRSVYRAARGRSLVLNHHFCCLPWPVKVPDMVDLAEDKRQQQDKLHQDQFEKQLPTNVYWSVLHHKNVNQPTTNQPNHPANPGEIHPLLGGDNIPKDPEQHEGRPRRGWARVKGTISSGSIYLSNKAQMDDEGHVSRWSDLSNYLNADELTLWQCLQIYIVLNATGKSSRVSRVAPFAFDSFELFNK